jgi:hypothetical protein
MSIGRSRLAVKADTGAPGSSGSAAARLANRRQRLRHHRHRDIDHRPSCSAADDPVTIHGRGWFLRDVAPIDRLPVKAALATADEARRRPVTVLPAHRARSSLPSVRCSVMTEHRRCTPCVRLRVGPSPRRSPQLRTGTQFQRNPTTRLTSTFPTTIMRRATQLLGEATDHEKRTATIRVAPVRLVCECRVDLPDHEWPLARPLFVALDLAQDPDRGRAILKEWTPPEAVGQRVW